MTTLRDILEENSRRVERITVAYNPLTGDGAVGGRVQVSIPDAPIPNMRLSQSLAETPLVSSLGRCGFRSFVKELTGECNAVNENAVWRYFVRLRSAYDFEFWAYSFIQIKAKGKAYDTPFLLNRAQRKTLAYLEELRLSGNPIKVVILKARQWGGSTLVQIYMLWIQLVHKRNWNSVICGDVEGQSRNVRSMISKALASYPSWMTETKTVIKFTPFEGSNKNKIIQNTNCVISIGSAQKPDTLRSSDISMAHLTEVGLWKETKGKKPEDIIQSIIGSLYDTSYSFLALESTAKGVGNYFHRTWIAATTKASNFTPIFIAWFDIDLYSEEIKDIEQFATSLDEQEQELWRLGATLQAIAWYRKKKKDLGDDWRMASEYPSTAEEAFQSTGRRRFRMSDTLTLRKTCTTPEFIGDIIGADETGENAVKSLRLEKDSKGNLHMWVPPDDEPILDRYVVIVDPGGISDTADPSDILVLDRYWMMEAGAAEVVAEWHGHIEHDKLAWKAAQIATYYNNALLVIESNTLETESTEGNNFEYILDEIALYYGNLYSRTPSDKILQGIPARWGFHTNSSTKPLVINHLAKAMRTGMYVERSHAAVDEMDVFEIKENGREMGAVDGMHDDRVMTRAIGVWICYKLPAPELREITRVRPQRLVSESTI